MRIKTFTKGGYIDGGFTSGGGTMTGPLVLFGDPTKELEAATKQYVDSKTTSFVADKFTSGTLQVGRLPALGGDIVSSTGSNSVSLVNTGVSAGAFTKVTVNAKGLVTAGGSLTETDIPNLDWSKIATGKPTTLTGYGITDAVSKTGGTVSGALTLHADPISANHLATKQYVDNNAGGVSALKTGDIISKMVSTTPTGFLKCNGAELSKTTYAALYAVIGDTYTGGNLVAGNGQPWNQQYEINTTQPMSLTPITLADRRTSSSTYSQACFVTKNRVYMIGGYVNGGGGYNGSNFYHRQSYAPINADGTLGVWVNEIEAPDGMFGHRAVVTRNKVHLIGGLHYNGNSRTIWTASINSDGTIGTWTATANALPVQLSDSHVAVTKNYIYVMGGFNSSTSLRSTAIYMAQIYGDGSLGAWTTSAVSLPVATQDGHLIVTKNRFYLIGGDVGSATSNIFTASIDTNGLIGTWSAANSFPTGIMKGQSYVTKNTAYIMGGESSGYNLNVYGAPINADGTLGTWSIVTTMETGRVRSDLIATSSKLYLLNGGNATSFTNQIYFCDLVGGLNDYSKYYDGSVLPTSTTDFRLPDLTASDLSGSYSYIKT